MFKRAMIRISRLSKSCLLVEAVELVALSFGEEEAFGRELERKGYLKCTEKAVKKALDLMGLTDCEVSPKQ